MTSKQRAYLRGCANQIESIFQVGKEGVTDVLAEQLSNALEARELIKLTVLKNAPDYAKDIANEIAEKTNSDVIQVIGNKIVLFRQKKENSKFWSRWPKSSAFLLVQ